MQKITKKHVFADGNKRTAIAATTFFLRKNEYQITFTKDKELKFTLYVTNSDDTEKVMKFAADWLKTRSKKLN